MRIRGPLIAVLAIVACGCDGTDTMPLPPDAGSPCDTAGCAQTCTNGDGGVSCGCEDGFELNADGTSCDDIDECADANGGCAQACTNVAGGLSCGCEDGFVLNADGTNCGESD